MDGTSFDQLTQRVATATSRRSLLKSLVGGMLAVGFGGPRADQADAASCRSVGAVCATHANCCSGICGDKDRHGRRKCTCPPGLEEKHGECVDPTTAYLADVKNCGAPGNRCRSTTCQSAVCVNGVCGLTPNPNAVGKRCDDGKSWTTNDICQVDGSCAGTLKPCPTPDQCHDQGVRDRDTGVCSTPPKANGAPCAADNDACTVDTCQGGVCTASAPKDCTTDPAYNDQCNSGVCNPTTGQCERQPKRDGTTCDDGNACTQPDTCQAGTCVGSNPVVCPEPDQCHERGACDPQTGTCSNPVKSNGTPCSDNNACTNTDTCQEGVCTPGTDVVCTSPSPCQVEGSGTCNATTGQCEYTNKVDNAPCDAGVPCTTGDSCQAGVCVAGDPLVCTAPDQCHDAYCDQTSGECVYPNKENGSACDDGDACTQTDTCQEGICVGGNPVTCAALDQCHDIGTCNAATGVCTNPPKSNNSPCDTGNRCTENDTCQGGVCVDGNAVTCVATDQCHDAGTCDPQTGCSNPAKTNGTPCGGGNCIAAGTCQSGSCVGGGPVVCAPLDDCHVAGVCDPRTGCSNPRTANGTPCADDNPLCVNGSCCADCCFVYDDLLKPDSGNLVHCPTGQTCLSLDVSFLESSAPPNASVCCAGGGGCFDFDPIARTLDAICCDAGQTCQMNTVSGVPIFSCCAGEVCPTIVFDGSTPSLSSECCGGDTTCSTISSGGLTVGACCAPATTVRLDAGSPGLPRVVCEAPCQTEHCIVPNSQQPSGFEEICCPTDTSCAQLEHSGYVGVGLCCPDPARACVTSYSPDSRTYGCCEGTCKYVDFGTGFDFCCPEGKEPRIGLGPSNNLTPRCFDECATELCYQGSILSLAANPICCPEGTSCVPPSYGVSEIPLIGKIGTCCSSTAKTCQSTFSFDPLAGGCCDGECQALPGFGNAITFCCPTGSIATLDATTGRARCVDLATHCPTFSSGLLQPAWQECAENTTCSTVQLESVFANLMVGACCPSGESVAFVNGGFGCCPDNRQCGSVQGSPICCAEGESCVSGICVDLDNPPTCGADQELVYNADSEVICCDADAICSSTGTTFCCAEGTSCRGIQLGFCDPNVTAPCPFPTVNLCIPDCPAGYGFALDPIAREHVCCAEDHLCDALGIPGFPICCPSQETCADGSCLFGGIDPFTYANWAALENTYSFPLNFTTP